MEKKQTLTLAAVLTVWVIALFLGQSALRQYALTEGEKGVAPTRWPTSSQLIPAAQGASTALLFLHPKCPCSEASVAELDRFMARVPKSTKVYAVFVAPTLWDDGKIEGPLWQQAMSVPGLQAVVDRDGREAQAFGARTSGQFFLYRSGGERAFQGGITPARGHQGDNVGLSSAIALAHSQAALVSETKVFGCALFSQPPSAE